MYNVLKSGKKQYKDKIGTKNCSNAISGTLEYGAGEVFFKGNGEVAVFEIDYSGAFKGVSCLGDGWIMKANNKKIIICSLAQTPLKNRLFNYIGQLKIKRVKFVNWDKQISFAQIKSIEKVNWSSLAGNWNTLGRKPEEIFKDQVIHKKILKTKV